DDLGQLLLGLVDPGHVVEGHGLIGCLHPARARAPERHQPAGAAAGRGGAAPAGELIAWPSVPWTDSPVVTTEVTLWALIWLRKVGLYGIDTRAGGAVTTDASQKFRSSSPTRTANATQRPFVRGGGGVPPAAGRCWPAPGGWVTRQPGNPEPPRRWPGLSRRLGCSAIVRLWQARGPGYEEFAQIPVSSRD